jgi:1-acyl-sn-glycerol-3-phosphate acyltransferase
MTLWHLARAVVETARISAPTIAEGLTGALTPEVCDERLAEWSRRLLLQAKITLRVEGLDRARTPGETDETFVVMSNHQSHYDIPVMFQALRRRVRMVAKQELFKIPGWGPAMRMAGFVEIDRKNRVAAIQSLESAKQALSHGTNIWIAPEGTRGPGDKLLPFKSGGFHLALGAGARILPVSIDGTGRVLAARGRTVTEGVEVRVTVHEPVEPSQYGADRREELTQRVRQAIASDVSSLRDKS